MSLDVCGLSGEVGVTPQSLRHFMAVVKHGTLGAASEALHISQTGLTKSIQRLEAQLGGRLFHRSARGMRLTRAGEALVPHAQLSLAHTARARDAVGDLLEGRGGTLTVGTAPEWLTLFVEDAVLDVHRAFPDMRIKVHSGRNTQSLVDDLRRGHLDIVVGVTQLEAMEDLEFEHLACNQQGIIAACDHPLHEAGEVPLSLLREHDWVLPMRGTVFRARLEDAFRAADVPPPEPVIETDFMSFSVSCVGRSRLLGTASRGSIAALGLTNVRHLRTATLLDRPVGILLRAGEPLTTPQLRFLDHVRGVARRMPAFLASDAKE